MANDPTNDNNKKINENDSSINSELIRGHINTIILRTLYDGDKYGYEIINEIEEKSKGQYILKQPTLYSALKRLESQDYVTSYWGGVSNGGRRKYFQITDKGRKIVEQNLAEWEYSRTIIDSLISEKDYDFNNPPPAASVDFNLLKKSTTRVPSVKGEQDEEEFTYSDNEEASDAPLTEKDASFDDTVGSEPLHDEDEELPISAAETQDEQIEEVPYTDEEEAPPLNEEDKQRIHDNYKALIGEDAEEAYYTQISRRNEEEQLRQQSNEQPPEAERSYESNRELSAELLYANRPPEERNYKELIAKLYDNTRREEAAVSETESYPADEPQPYYDATVAQPTQSFQPEQLPPEGEVVGNIEFYDVEERAEQDGLRITTATGKRNNSATFSDARATFDKGRLLFITALWAFGVAMVEAIINACLSSVLSSGTLYCVLPFVFPVIMLLVFFILFARGYGRNSKKIKSRSYVSAALIIYVNILLVVCLIAFLVIGSSGEVTAPHIILYAVFPCIYLFNIPLFAIIYYYLFSKE